MRSEQQSSQISNSARLASAITGIKCRGQFGPWEQSVRRTIITSSFEPYLTRSAQQCMADHARHPPTATRNTTEREEAWEKDTSTHTWYNPQRSRQKQGEQGARGEGESGRKHSELSKR